MDLKSSVVEFGLETSGVDAGDGVELGDAALGGRVKALGLAAHLKEHFLFLQLPGKLLLQRLLPGSELLPPLLQLHAVLLIQLLQLLGLMFDEQVTLFVLELL